MHPVMSYELAQARIAELHRQAERDAIARAARRARRARQDDVSSHRIRWAAAAVGRGLRTVLVAATADLRRRVLVAAPRSTGE